MNLLSLEWAERRRWIRRTRKKSLRIHQSVSYALSHCVVTRKSSIVLFFCFHRIQSCVTLACVRERICVCVCSGDNRFIYIGNTSQCCAARPFSLLWNILIRFRRRANNRGIERTPQIPNDGCRITHNPVCVCAVCLFSIVLLRRNCHLPRPQVRSSQCCYWFATDSGPQPGIRSLRNRIHLIKHRPTMQRMIERDEKRRKRFT